MSTHRVGRCSVTAVVIASLLGAANCTGNPTVATNATKSRTAQDAQADSADQILYGVHAVLTDQGATKGMLSADRGYVFEDGTRIELRGVTVTFLDPVGITHAVMTSATGTYRLRQARFEVRGNVLVVAVGGRQLRSEQVVFDLTRNVLVGTAAYVRNDSTPKRETKGVGFEFAPTLTQPPTPILPKALPKPKIVAPGSVL